MAGDGRTYEGAGEESVRLSKRGPVEGVGGWNAERSATGGCILHGSGAAPTPGATRARASSLAQTRDAPAPLPCAAALADAPPISAGRVLVKA